MDDFDLICHIAFDTKPLTKSERAKRVHDKCEEYKLSVLANDIIDTLLDKYCNDGLTDIDDVNILKLDEFKQYGTPKTIVNEIFGGRENYIYTMNQIKETLYSRLLN
jgi:type I restriction enzyme R subunit